MTNLSSILDIDEAVSRIMKDKELAREFVTDYLRILHAADDNEATIHDALAEALCYKRGDPNDPDCPCGGQFITGDHVAASLALEAAQKIKELRRENEHMKSMIIRKA